MTITVRPSIAEDGRYIVSTGAELLDVTREELVEIIVRADRLIRDEVHASRSGPAPRVTPEPLATVARFGIHREEMLRDIESTRVAPAAIRDALGRASG